MPIHIVSVHVFGSVHTQNALIFIAPLQGPVVIYFIVLFQSLMNMLKQDSIGSGNVSEWDYTVRIVLVEGIDLLSMDDNGLSDPYIRFKLQNEKYKSKVS